MDNQDWLAKQFEENRGRLRAVAYRMLGSVNEAEDAVQEAWLRLSRSEAGAIDNLPGWLTTVVSRICLDMLRARSSHGEELLSEDSAAGTVDSSHAINPEQETLMADSVSVALLVMLDRLAPAERLALVLHDMFGFSFDEIASIVGRSPIAARQLASRARRRVQGAQEVPIEGLRQQREATEAFLTALRNGDIEGLLAVLDPEVVVRIDAASSGSGAPREIRGAVNWARGAVAFSRSVGVQGVETALVDGTVGMIWAPQGKLQRVLRITFAGGKIAGIEIIGDPERLRELDLAVLS